MADLIMLCVLVVIAAGMVAVSVWRRRHHDAALASGWDALCARREVTPGGVLLEVVEVYQRAQRGTKAVVRVGRSVSGRVVPGGVETPPGSVWLVALPATGWGPHNQNPVLYLNPAQLLGTAPPGTAAAVERHRRRTRPPTGGDRGGG